MLTWQELQSKGIVMEINRRLLHPRGLALQYNARKPEERGEAIAPVWFFHSDVEKMRAVFERCRALMEASGEWNEEWALYFASLFERVQEATDAPDVAHLQIFAIDDPEGIIFGDLNEGDRERAARFMQMVNITERVKGCGFLIEPHVGKAWREVEP
jgi:hypothetical protein